MNLKTKVLCAFAVLLFLGSMATTSLNPYISTVSAKTDQMVPANTYGDDRRNDAVSILIQTQFVDTRTNYEWDKVLASLKSSLYGKFTYDNLTDYTQLGSVIDEYDVLLIPENEYGNASSSAMIAGAWSSFLPSYVENGGIVICMSFANIMAQYGITPLILNGTGLMEIHNPVNSQDNQMNLVDTDDALARSMPTSYTATSATVSFDTNDGTVVVEDDTNGQAVVVHKTMGMGHVILLGFDMYFASIYQDRLLRNALLLHNHVIFDNSHGQDLNITGGYSILASALPIEGLAVSSANTFSTAVLEACDIFVITTCVSVYTSEEMTVLDDFVNNGGALFIQTECSIWGLAQDPLLEHFGYERKTYGDLNDTDDYHDDVAYVDLYPENLNMHSVKVGVDIVEVHGSSAFLTMPESAVPILTTDDDGTVWWSYTHLPPDPAGGLPIAAVETIGEGRIALIADNSPLVDIDHDSDGFPDFLDADNQLFIENIFRWLAGAGIPEQTVVFDYSKSPWGYLHSTLQPLAEFLMFNGYNTIWMEDFDPAVYDEADILFICDGAFAYNTSEIAYIENYVAEGGALLLWGDYGTYSAEIAPIALEFDLAISSNGYIVDTDDYIVDKAYVVYEGSNLGTHPIMDGVERIEVGLGTAFDSIGSGTALISTDGDGTSDWDNALPADNLAVYAVTTYEQGRVGCITDQNLGGPTDFDADGFPALYDSDNPIFVANLFKWLAENRVPTVEVSSPNGGETVSGEVSVTWDSGDFDNDPLTFDIFYSDDNGGSWTSLGTGITGTSILWNTSLVNNGDEYLIRVEVSDGEFSVEDVSDETFTVNNTVVTTLTSTGTGTGNGTGPGSGTTTIIIIIIVAGVVIVIIIVIVKGKKG